MPRRLHLQMPATRSEPPEYSSEQEDYEEAAKPAPAKKPDKKKASEPQARKSGPKPRASSKAKEKPKAKTVLKVRVPEKAGRRKAPESRPELRKG